MLALELCWELAEHCDFQSEMFALQGGARVTYRHRAREGSLSLNLGKCGETLVSVFERGPRGSRRSLHYQ